MCVIVAPHQDKAKHLARPRFRLSPSLVIILTIFIDITGFGIVIPLLPFYATSFQAGSAALGILVASFSGMQFVFAPLLGRLSDRAGRKPILMISIVTSAMSFVLFAVANSFFVLLLSRLVAGMATETAIAQAYMADVTPEEDRAAGMGRLGAAFGVGFIIGPAIGGALSVFGFWVPGAAAVILTLLNLLFVFFLLPESLDRGQEGLQMESYVKGGYFGGWRSALATPLIGATLIVVFIIILAFSAIPVIAPLLGVSFFNLGAVEMSYVFMYIGLVQIVLQGFLFGKLARRFSEEKFIAFGPLLMSVGMFMMPMVPNILTFLVSITMIALGIGVLDAAVPSFISKRTLKSEQGGMLGVSQSVSSIARVPGPLIGGFVFEFVGLMAPFLLSSALLVVAFILGCRIFHACRPQGPL